MHLNPAVQSTTNGCISEGDKPSGIGKGLEARVCPPNNSPLPEPPSGFRDGAATSLLQEAPSAPIRVYVGIDGGSSGAVAAVDETGAWQVALVAAVQERGHWLLSVDQNLEFLRLAVAKAGGLDNVLVAYEQSRKNPMFGSKNNFVNGRNEEFWRVLLTVKGFRHCSVDPKTWQSVCLKGINSTDTKVRAREYIRRMCPETTWLDCYNKAPREAIVDAMCIALWCKASYHDLAADHCDSIEP